MRWSISAAAFFRGSDFSTMREGKQLAKFNRHQEGVMDTMLKACVHENPWKAERGHTTQAWETVCTQLADAHNMELTVHGVKKAIVDHLLRWHKKFDADEGSYDSECHDKQDDTSHSRLWCHDVWLLYEASQAQKEETSKVKLESSSSLAPYSL
jgi:hypothetical protein